MTFMHIRDQGLPKHALGERRFDAATADKVRDALRAHGLQTAAQAMEHQCVSLAVALRVLGEPGRRREKQAAPAAALAQAVTEARYAHFADLAEFTGFPA
jgi:hypothetical protein